MYNVILCVITIKKVEEENEEREQKMEWIKNERIRPTDEKRYSQKRK
jgi:hypothetical protein